MFILLAVSTSSFAVSLGTYRIYLDRQHRDYDFIISNRDPVPQNCKLNLTHYNMDKNGTPQLVEGDVLPDNSAVNLLRYSPRNFSIDPQGRQTVRFRMRNQSGVEKKEYRSYLEVNCQMVEDKTEIIDGKLNSQVAGISLTPQLVHQVPIIVRPFNLDIQVEITDINVDLNNDTVTFAVKRSGERSIFFDIELINKNNNTRIALKKNGKIYPENNEKVLTLRAKGIPSEDLLIRLTEDKRTGGDLILEKSVK